MIVKTHITFRDYVKLLYTLAYKKPMMIFLLFIDLLLILWVVFYYTGFLNLPKPVIYQYITLVLITLVQPLVIYMTIRENYYSSSHLMEPVTIEFSKEEIKITGDSFYTVLTWGKTYKTVELRNWFMIYQNTLSAVIIPKRAFEAGRMEVFIELLKSISVPDLKLKHHSAGGVYK